MQLLNDLRIGARALRRRPGYTMVAALTLALGIGANTAVFGVVHRVLVRPLPFDTDRRLVHVRETHEGEPRGVAPGNFVDWQESGVLPELSAYSERVGNLLHDGEPRRVRYTTVSSNFFRTVGAGALHGRTFRPDDASAGTVPAVLSYRYWRDAYGGAPAAVGRTFRMDETSYEIVGVADPALDFPAGTELYTRAPYDVPGLLGMGPEIRQMRDAWYFDVIGRLPAGATVSQAQDALAMVARRLAQEHVENENAGVQVRDLHEVLVGDVRPRLLILLTAVALVLLVACANVANLVLVRAVGRSRELAVRAAMGAGRPRLVLCMVAESAVLAGIGAAAGVALALLGRRALSAVVPAGTGLGGGAPLSWTLLASALVLALVSVVGAGIAPAVVASGVRLGGLRAGRGSIALSRGGARLRTAFIAAQVAMAVVLVAGAGLLVRSFAQLQRVEPGFASEALVTARIALPGARALDADAIGGVYEQILERVRALPGVQGAAAASSGPLDDGPGAGLRIEERPRGDHQLPSVSRQAVSHDYFATAGIRVIRGRSFTPSDAAGSVPVAIVNRRMAEQHWPGADPIGKRINTGMDGQGLWVTIVGVVEDTRNEGLAGDVSPEYYRPLLQPARSRAEDVLLLVRTTLPPATVKAPLREAVRAVRADMPVFDVRTADEILSQLNAQRRLLMRLLTGFAALALLLGGIGIYGMAAHSVGERKAEVGVRLALGARPSSILQLFVLRGLGPVAAGAVIGLAAARYATALLQPALFGVAPVDPVTFAATPLVLLLVSLAALAVPAVRAARVPPADVLRGD